MCCVAKKGLGITVGINFEDISSVKKKFEQLQGQVNKEAKNGIKLGLDLDARQINEIMSKLTNLTKSEIKILPSGEITTLAKYNTELGKHFTALPSAIRTLSACGGKNLEITQRKSALHDCQRIPRFPGGRGLIRHNHKKTNKNQQKTNPSFHKNHL